MIKTYTPPPALAEYINCFWSLDNISEDLTELVYPNGKIQLIFHYRKPFTEIVQSGMENTQPQYAVCGQKTSYNHVRASGDSGMVAAVLRTYSASALLHIPLCELTDDTVSFTDIFRDWKSHEQGFNDCNDDRTRIGMICNFLGKRIKNITSCHDYFVKSCVDEIRNSRGLSAPIHSMNRFGFSERSLQRIFRDHVGLSPKRYAEIVRLENSIALFGRGRSMTDVCYEAGYYDQPHFIRSFRQYTGLSPSEFEKLI